MNKSYRAEPTHPGYGGEASFEAYAKRDDVAALPGIDVAMWHEDFKPYEDVSRFNDIYYDLYDIEEDLGDDVMVLYLFGALHNMTLVVFMILPFTPLWPFKNDEWHRGYFYAYLLSLFFYMAVLIFAKGAFNNIGVRLNRQAQLIHFALGKNDYYHVPWKNIRPFTYHERSNKLVLGYPLPEVEREKFEDDSLERLYGKEPPHLGIEFTAGDNTGIFDNLHRLEFIRRYMELGVEGIKPPEGVEPKKMATNRQEIYSFKNINSLFSFFAWLTEAMFYWPAGGPLIDRWVRYEARKFKWPEEVERLCTPGADLTGFDTRPVRPSEVLFYRFTGFEFEIVDAEGRKVTGAGLDFLQDRSLYPKED